MELLKIIVLHLLLMIKGKSHVLFRPTEQLTKSWLRASLQRFYSYSLV